MDNKKYIILYFDDNEGLVKISRNISHNEIKKRFSDLKAKVEEYPRYEVIDFTEHGYLKYMDNSTGFIHIVEAIDKELFEL
jgi:hypothetical protein